MLSGTYHRLSSTRFQIEASFCHESIQEVLLFSVHDKVDRFAVIKNVVDFHNWALGDQALKAHWMPQLLAGCGGLSAKFCTTSTLNQLMIWFWEDVILNTFAKVKIICYNVVFALSQTMMYKNKTINSFHIIQHIRSKPPGCRWAGAKQLWHRLRRSWASARISSAAPGRWPHTWSGEEKNKKEFGLRALRLSILAALFAPFVNFRLFGPCRHCIMSCACVSIVIVFSQEKVMHLTTHDGQV